MPLATVTVPPSGSSISANQVDAIAGAAANGIGAFVATNAAAGNAIAAVGTSGAAILYNPAGSGVLVKILKVQIGYVSGTTVAGNLGYAYQINPTLSSLTQGGAILNAVPGRGQSPKSIFYTAATVAAAPTWMGTNGMNLGGAQANGPGYTWVDNVDGAIGIPPGVGFWPCVSINAVTLTANITVYFVEVPMATTY